METRLYRDARNILGLNIGTLSHENGEGVKDAGFPSKRPRDKTSSTLL